MNLSQLGRRYRMFLRLIRLTTFLPRNIAYPTAPFFAYFGLSPISHQQQSVKNAILNAHIPFSNWSIVWKKRLADHAIFCMNAFYHPQFNKQWLQDQVEIDSEFLRGLAKEHKSILLLTYHHPFHHTLFCVLGLLGLQTHVLAAQEESSLLFSYIGQYIKRLHKGCTKHFNGGGYLFFKNDIAGARMAKRVLLKGGVLVSLNDFMGDETKYPSSRLFNRRVSSPNGSIKLAQRMGVPIVTAIMVRTGNRYRVILQQIENNQSEESIMEDYFSFLSNVLLEHPEIWDGWDWFSSFPLIENRENT